MTIDEFLEKLAATKETIKWKIINENIRGFDCDGFSYCPITAVDSLVNRIKCTPAYWYGSARQSKHLRVKIEKALRLI